MLAKIPCRNVKAAVPNEPTTMPNTKLLSILVSNCINLTQRLGESKIDLFFDSD
jgi:hypothetical protein